MDSERFWSCKKFYSFVLGVPAFLLLGSGFIQYLAKGDEFIWWLVPVAYPFMVAGTYAGLSFVGIVPLEDANQKSK